MTAFRPDIATSCQPGSSCCRSPQSLPILRRDVLKTALAVGVTALLPSKWVWAADGQAFTDLVPADKRLSPTWLASLTAKGTPRVCRGDDLRYIGLPVGGLCAGLVYVSGDGRLWLWDIKNLRKEGIDGKSTSYNGRKLGPMDGTTYVAPRLPTSPFQQGFSLCWKAGENRGSRTLDSAGGWADIAFSGSYPMGRVAYRDPVVPVQVDLEAYSPFIPLNTADSSLPATIMRYTITNPGTVPVMVELAGWLENSLPDDVTLGVLTNRTVTRPGATMMITDIVVRPQADPNPATRDDLGTMAIAILDARAQAIAVLPEGKPAEVIFDAQETAAHGRPIGGVRHAVTIPAGGHAVIIAVVAWHFPNYHVGTTSDSTGRWYAKQFPDVAEVVSYLATNHARLYRDTVMWCETWNNSTLPCWVLDRTFCNTAVLATTTCTRYGDGRFWAWEGVGCCDGTCTHVWGYAQAMGRLFPELERDLRERTDYGLAFDPNTGVINFRGQSAGLAVDGQAMVILRTLREHQMSADDRFLRSLWPRVKRSMQCLMEKDAGDGLLGGAQANTLDSQWYGKVSWLSGLYLAALSASATMADEMGDAAFATECRKRGARGSRSMVTTLFNGQYFANRLDPNHLNEINSGTGCLIDQVMGQSWAFQVNLGRVLPETETRTALRNLWKYNFSPDIGPWREANKEGRWYILPGEMGLLMCTFPRPDWDYARAKGVGHNDNPAWFAGYFNECQSGYEWEVASHMINEGMLTEGLAIGRAIHDRYAPAKRNPFNEIECSDHYARSMTSYGSFIALCGFDCHGPKGHLGFAPKLSPDHFKAAFTSATGWGSFAQERASTHLATIALRYGTLRLATLALQPKHTATAVTAMLNNVTVPATVTMRDGTAMVRFTQSIAMTAGQKLVIQLS